MARRTYYITTPIYYVNDQPHLGHAYTTVICDCIARFKRLDEYDVKFLTGTDEHGQKVQKSAEKIGVDTHEFVDRVSQNFRELFVEMQLTYDDFIRTSEKRHVEGAQHFWQLLADKGEIYLGKYEGWYALRDEAYYAEAELVDGKAPTGAPVTWEEEPSYFFKLSKWQEPLLDYYQRHPDFILPHYRRNEVINFVESGLRDLSISRRSFKWGIPVPGDPDHVMYVWFDALTNYITAIGYPNQQDEFSRYWPANLQMVGKDILRFHTVYWPAMLMAAGLPLPEKIFAHGFWTNEGQKMSKSLGNGIDPYVLIEKFGVDQTRYFLIREVPLGNDGDFSYAAVETRINSNLANDFGNLVQRVLAMIHKNCDASIPEHAAFTEEDEELLRKAHNLLNLSREYVDKQQLHRYCESIWDVIAAANRYVDYQAPWTLRKVDLNRMKTVLYVLAEVLRYVGILVQPIVPQAASLLLDYLSVPTDQRTFKSLTVLNALKPGSLLPPAAPLFPRIFDDKAA